MEFVSEVPCGSEGKRSFAFKNAEGEIVEITVSPDEVSDILSNSETSDDEKTVYQTIRKALGPTPTKKAE